jgi:hypothetical protein
VWSGVQQALARPAMAKQSSLCICVSASWLVRAAP